MINLNGMTEAEFEELCYDLLVKLGFKNINWRKGTGKTGNTSDSGRDIEATLIINDIDNTIYEEKWYIECKHYLNGISADKIVNAITWASAEKVDKLLIISSNFLSNSCKQYIEKIKTTIPFKIKVWENKELETMLNSHIDLLHKYRINKNFSAFEIMNPYHISYITCLQNNTLEYFLNILKKIDGQKREEIFELTYSFFADSYGTREIAENVKSSRKMKSRKIYKDFVKKCKENLKTTSDIYLVNSIVNVTLQILFNKGNINNIENVLESRKEFLANILSIGLKDMSKKEIEENIKNDENAMALIEFFEITADKLPEQIKKDYELYNYFCNNVVAELLKEDYL